MNFFSTTKKNTYIYIYKKTTRKAKIYVQKTIAIRSHIYSLPDKAALEANKSKTMTGMHKGVLAYSNRAAVGLPLKLSLDLPVIDTSSFRLSPTGQFSSTKSLGLCWATYLIYVAAKLGKFGIESNMSGVWSRTALLVCKDVSPATLDGATSSLTTEASEMKDPEGIFPGPCEVVSFRF